MRHDHLNRRDIEKIIADADRQQLHDVRQRAQQAAPRMPDRRCPRPARGRARPRAHGGKDEFQAISRLWRAKVADFCASAQVCAPVVIFGNGEQPAGK
jgi:hypothetical protein